MKSAILLGAGTIAVFFGAIGGWCAWAPLDGAVIGTGSLAVHGQTKTVQHREGGTVAALMVAEGDHVRQGQVLLRLDDSQALAALRVHEAERMADEATVARDTAEIGQAPGVDFPSDLRPSDPTAASITARELLIFAAHRSLRDQQDAVLAERVDQARQQEAGARAQFDSSGRAQGMAEEELQSLTSLRRVGLAAQNHVLETARMVETLRGETGQLRAEIARHQAEAAELHAETLRQRQAMLADCTREMRDAQARLNDVTPRLAADRDLLERLAIRAPVEGDVLNLAVFNRGAVVEPGKPILEIVPHAPTLVAEAQIRTEDIEYLHVGQPTQVIATGFDTRENAPIEGRIEVISADRVTDPRNGQSYFKAELSLLRDRQGGALLRQLEPGMPIEIVVRVRPRTALEYLTEPLRKSLRGALHEM